jgi:hypothetical protein
MKTNQYHRYLLGLAAALGLATAALAGGEAANPPPPVIRQTGQGLLGQEYASLTYRYVDLDGSAGHADNYRFDFNEPLKPGFDGLLGFDRTAASAAIRQTSITTGLRAYCPDLAWGKPYVEAGAGYTWAKTPGATDDSFLWRLEAGAEFQTASAVTVTPFVRYEDAPSLSRGSRWDFGVKANYWLDHQWAVTVGLDRDDHQNTGFMVGTNFRF